MSIRDCLVDCVREERLFEIVPLLPAPSTLRSVWVSEEVFMQLEPETADEDFALEAGRVRRKLESIVKGSRLVVGAHRNKACDLKRLTPAANEVWEVRERDDPSVRVFFRFVEKDCLAGTNIDLVRNLFQRLWTRAGVEYFPNWAAAITRCKAIWRQLFLTYPPHSGASIHDYLSNTVGPSSF